MPKADRKALQGMVKDGVAVGYAQNNRYLTRLIAVKHTNTRTRWREKLKAETQTPTLRAPTPVRCLRRKR